MSDPNTLRILSIDGGGVRGLIPNTFMELFVQQWGINPNEIWKYFDVITGSSIGAIVGLAYAFGLSPADITPFFTTDSPWIFTVDSANPSIKPSILSKVNTIINGPFANPTFYPSNTAGIGTMRLNSKLALVFGTNTLQNMKTNVIVTGFEKNDNNPDFSQYTNTPVYFSNISSNIVPILLGQNSSAVDVLMSTSAAPLYFPPWIIGSNSYIDGGITQNNPSSFALAVAQAIKPTANRYCILSLGTGLGDVGFPPSGSFKKELLEFRISPKLYAEKWKITHKEMESLKNIDNLGILEGAYLLMYLLGARGAGPQEIVAKELEIQAKYTLNNLYYYRMQYYLDPTLNTELDNSTTDILLYYKNSATSYYNNDIDNITTFIGHLTA